MSAAPRLSIIIVSFNTRGDLQNCLASLADGAVTASHEVIVVDNASTDGSADAVRQSWPGVTVIDAGRNLGFAAANNVGIRASLGEVVVLLNSDTLIRRRALDTLLARLTESPAIGAIGPRIVDAAGRPELSFGRMLAPLAECRQKLLVGFQARRVGIAERYVDRLTRTARDADWVSGACLMVRRADAESAGLLDERYFLYAEDVDFCAAIRALGKRVRFDPAAEIVHLRGQSRATRPAASERAYRRAHLAFYAKHHPRWAPLLRVYLRMRGKWPEETR